MYMHIHIYIYTYIYVHNIYVHTYIYIYIYIIYIYIPFLPCPCAPFLSFLPLCLSLLFSSPLREFCIPHSPGMLYVYMLHIYIHTYMCVHTALHAYICTHGTVLYNAVYIYSGGRGGMRCCICIMLCTFTMSDMRQRGTGTALYCAVCCAVSVSV